MNKIIHGDCIEQLKLLEENSVDAIITDPPYGLEFMGKEWDKFGVTEARAKRLTQTEPKTGDPKYDYLIGKGRYSEMSLSEIGAMQKFFFGWAKECLRVLKPGGFLLSFGGTRTYHRLVCGIEDAGFEIRDTIMWLYGSGFPKSLNVGKQVDKIQGNERIKGDLKFKGGTQLGIINDDEWKPKDVYEDRGSSEWEGWGTALKPACEPIVVARKPLSEKNVALNVLKHGTGGMNIDACRIGNEILKEHKTGNIPNDRGKWGLKEGFTMSERQGRFPANIILDEEAGRMLDEQSGDLSQGHWSKSKVTGFGDFGGGKQEYFGVGEKDKTKHGASRFFYCAKASKSERNFGCEEMEQKDMRKEDGSARSMEIFSNQYTESSGNPTGRGITSKRANNHPTVKPIALMEYLIKLVSREGAIILDPFIGSGTTAIACVKTNRMFIGIEKEAEYIKIAEARIKPFLEQTKLQ